MNHFMARLIFCFFAEDTDIFRKADLFTDTVAQMTEKDSSNTHEVIGTIFRAMNTKNEDRAAAKLPRWADAFWRPWRSVAARVLWTYYRAVKGREGPPVEPTKGKRGKNGR